MASLRQLRRRIRSIENIHEITKAMEMIASFRFKKAENRFIKAGVYFSELEKIASNLASAVENLMDPLFTERKVRRKTLVVMTGDKGLCGSYNTNLLRDAMQWYEKNLSYGPTFVAIGKVGVEFMRKRGLPTAAAYPEKNAMDLAAASKLAGSLKDEYLAERTDEVRVLYTAYHAGGIGHVREVPYLGLGYLAGTGPEARGSLDYIYEPDFERFFATCVSRYLDKKMNYLLLESMTSENNARRIAMHQATENGGEMLDELTLLRNKTRQAVITRELTEIVSGADALR